MDACDNAFAGISPRPNERHRLFDERSTIGLMLAQAVGRTSHQTGSDEENGG